MDKKQIEKQAKEILDRFAGALDKGGASSDESEASKFAVEREEFERDEIISSDESEASVNAEDYWRDFKKELLENAPKKNEDFIIVEKGEWKNG
jgi:Asp-tRNA(Asn)/Glu-tRNA(Gln) amidotransferase C subunit